MTPLEQARADLDRACDEFNDAARTTTPPDRLERAVRRLMASVESYCEMVRS